MHVCAGIYLSVCRERFRHINVCTYMCVSVCVYVCDYGATVWISVTGKWDVIYNPQPLYIRCKSSSVGLHLSPWCLTVTPIRNQRPEGKDLDYASCTVQGHANLTYYRQTAPDTAATVWTALLHCFTTAYMAQQYTLHHKEDEKVFCSWQNLHQLPLLPTTLSLTRKWHC